MAAIYISVSIGYSSASELSRPLVHLKVVISYAFAHAAATTKHAANKIIIKFGISFTEDYMYANLPVAAIICHAQIKERCKFHVRVLKKLRNSDSVGSNFIKQPYQKQDEK